MWRDVLVVQTRLVHIAPAELLLPETGLSRPTEKMLLHFAECVFDTSPHVASTAYAL